MSIMMALEESRNHSISRLCRPLPDPIRDWEFIEITPEEVHHGGADVVMIHPNKAVVSADQPRLARDLEERGIEVQMVDVSSASQISAGVRCCTIIIHREKARLPQR